MKRLVLTILVLSLVVIGIAGPVATPSQAVPLGGPCDIAAEYNWMYQFWNLACEQYMLDYPCIVNNDGCPD